VVKAELGDGEKRNSQLPITTVFTRRVRRVYWFSAVLFVNKAVV
jgi:hypothetical protein